MSNSGYGPDCHVNLQAVIYLYINGLVLMCRKGLYCIDLKQEPLTKEKICGLFSKGFCGHDIVIAFSPPEYCSLVS